MKNKHTQKKNLISQKQNKEHFKNIELCCDSRSHTADSTRRSGIILCSLDCKYVLCYYYYYYYEMN